MQTGALMLQQAKERFCCPWGGREHWHSQYGEKMVPPFQRTQESPDEEKHALEPLQAERMV